MRLTIEETERRRSIQLAYNEQHGITPQPIVKARTPIIGQEKKNAETKVEPKQKLSKKAVSYDQDFSETESIAADPVIAYMNETELKKSIEKVKAEMIEAAKNMDFISAAQLRDEMLRMEDLLKDKDK